MFKDGAPVTTKSMLAEYRIGRGGAIGRGTDNESFMRDGQGMGWGRDAGLMRACTEVFE